MDSYTLGKPMFSGDGFNIVKFMLSILSMFFDTIFMIQRYVLYPAASKAAARQEKYGTHVRFLTSVRQHQGAQGLAPRKLSLIKLT